mmetsp:Transcript_11207/g.38184  ORF Transcript_11207/g.38184 Transcript_11207/m.38184 type:complete len:286 (-) Transcript_11207:182-1039(-)
MSECSLLDTWGIAIQGLLGVGALSTLLYKRQLEVPRRPRLIWFYDASKQAFSSGLGHMLNVALSERVLVRLHATLTSPCAWYLVNLVLDTTLGTVVAYYVLRAAEASAAACADCAPPSCSSALSDAAATGHYGSPPSCQRWSLQVVLWMVVIVLVKAVIATVILIAAAPLHAAGVLLLAPFAALPRLRVFLVVLVIPLVLNVMQIWIQDNFLQLGGAYRASRTSSAGLRDQGPQGLPYRKCSTADTAGPPARGALPAAIDVDAELPESAGLMRDLDLSPGAAAES